MKQVFIGLIILAVAAGCSQETDQKGSLSNQASIQQGKQLSEQEKIIAVQKAKEDFISEFKVPEANVGEPLLYDLNNDGQDEIIIYTVKKTLMDKADVYVSVYNPQTGVRTVSKKFDDNGSAVSVFKINNPSYKKALAVVMYGNGGYLAEVFTVKKNEIVSIDHVASQFNDVNVIADADQDGYEEFKGFENESDNGSDRVPLSAGFVSEIVFKWDEKSKKYNASTFGEDGMQDAQRGQTSELTPEKALQILQTAYKLQLSWTGPKSEQEARKFMRPFFSNNFTYEFLNDNMGKSSGSKGIIPKYSQSDDTRWLLPSYTKADLQLSDDKTTATITQSIERNVEGRIYTVQATVVLVKTKYGWKIDKLTYSDANKVDTLTRLKGKWNTPPSKSELLQDVSIEFKLNDKKNGVMVSANQFGTESMDFKVLSFDDTSIFFEYKDGNKSVPAIIHFLDDNRIRLTSDMGTDMVLGRSK
ncbi:hypothetical protein [Paenibacillus validus]|uniref:hypothetical protein n=1 Tax=Paenibacillus validus TaxID=44253 RepID=UPI003D2B0617